MSAVAAGRAARQQLKHRLCCHACRGSARHVSTVQAVQTFENGPPQPRDMGMLFGGRDNAPKKDLGAVSLSQTGQFYQRSLPPAQVAFSSAHGRRLFLEALEAGYMENYFYLAEQFRTQDEPTFCGLTTLAMVLNSLRIDPMRTWKGAWRWYSEDMLSCGCTGPDRVREEGMSFDMFRSLALCHGAQVEAHRAPDAASAAEALAFEEALRSTVRAVSRSHERECLVICYSREPLGQTGAGHFSPVGGYHAGTDSVLILDVARFKYPPHWAPLREVAEAMRGIDPDTGRPRGFLRLNLQEQEADSFKALRPLYIPFVPAAAGRRLSEVLEDALSSHCIGLADEPAMTLAMRRWLHAASSAEPQVVRRLLQVGDADLLKEVVERLHSYSLYKDLSQAYSDLVASGGGFKGEFPPLRFGVESAESSAEYTDADAPGLDTCGELWVLLLLLLPEHLRAAVSQDLAGPFVAQGLPFAVRGPWALPLEALREALGQLLVAPTAANSCSTIR
mmetsp:Transcript_119286/g.210755  ORF Transcript_119286/g.210755 Transcript_119286/m.210755 type:complete len:505 (-) Transcript_119286:147-1661(-)